MDESQKEIPEEQPCWYVLRDLKRPNAKVLGYMELSDVGFQVFTPMKTIIVAKGSRREKRTIPVIADLLFVRSVRSVLDEAIDAIPTIQYRFMRGAYCKPMTVGDREMQQFINAVENSDKTIYYSPDEMNELSLGHTARIIGGPMDGVEGKILRIRGARKKRLLIELPSFISASVEVEPEFIQIID